MTKRYRTMILIALAGAVPAFADVMSVQPPALNVAAGQTFSIDLKISGATDLIGYNLDLGFDPSILAADSVTEGTFLPGAGATLFLPGTIDNTAGTISFLGDVLFSPSGAVGSGSLATVQFTALASGSSPINIFNVTALDSFGQAIAVTTTPGVVTVGAAVPEPGSVFLLLSIAGTLAFARRYARR